MWTLGILNTYMLLEEKKTIGKIHRKDIRSGYLYWYHKVDPDVTSGCGKDAVEAIEAQYCCSWVYRDED